MTRPATFPTPIAYHYIELLDKDHHGTRIKYTDCMESTVLRFVQAVLCDLASLSANGVPARVDLDLVRKRIRDRDLVEYFESYPEILPAEEYDEPCGRGAAAWGSKRGFDARQEWARLVTRKPCFRYKRSTAGVYMNDALAGSAKVPDDVQWGLELEPCVHNVCAVCRLLGCSDEVMGAAQDLNESARTDVSGVAQAQLDAALRDLSRPGLLLRGVIHPPERYSTRFRVPIELEVNGRKAWCWVLSRIFLTVAPKYFGLCAPDGEAGRTALITSQHAHIEVLNEDNEDAANDDDAAGAVGTGDGGAWRASTLYAGSPTTSVTK